MDETYIQMVLDIKEKVQGKDILSRHSNDISPAHFDPEKEEEAEPSSEWTFHRESST
jgi:hypothetical protein